LDHLENYAFYQTPKKVKQQILRKDGDFIGVIPEDENLKTSLVVRPYCSKIFHKLGHVRSFSKESFYNLLKQYFK